MIHSHLTFGYLLRCCVIMELQTMQFYKIKLYIFLVNYFFTLFQLAINAHIQISLSINVQVIISHYGSIQILNNLYILYWVGISQVYFNILAPIPSLPLSLCISAFCFVWCFSVLYNIGS